MDIVTGNLGSKNSIYFGDKKLSFNRVFDFKTERNTSSIKVSDLNQDGYLDIIEGNSEERNYVHLGQKNKEFKEIGLREDLKHVVITSVDRDDLKDGGSAIYGTDAVAGVVNYITRKKFTGATTYIAHS